MMELDFRMSQTDMCISGVRRVNSLEMAWALEPVGLPSRPWMYMIRGGEDMFVVVVVVIVVCVLCF